MPHYNHLPLTYYILVIKKILIRYKLTILNYYVNLTYCWQNYMFEPRWQYRVKISDFQKTPDIPPHAYLKMENCPRKR